MKKYLKKLNFRIRLKSKYLLIIMTLFCISVMITAVASGFSGLPFQNIAGLFIVPFEKSISKMSVSMGKASDLMKEKKDLLSEIEDLQSQIDSLTQQNNKLILDQEELARLEQMYDLDNEYPELPKVAARIISKDPGNWYNLFKINKGSNDGIRVDNNVIAGKGLVGIVVEVGPTWSVVRSIIDDNSNVSAMTVSTANNCVVAGDLELIDEGKLSFYQLYDIDNKVAVGERIVTSSISEKFLEGLFIGYVSEVGQDTNNLTKRGTLVTPIDFQHLRDVLVITVNKQDQLSDS